MTIEDGAAGAKQYKIARGDVNPPLLESLFTSIFAIINNTA